MNPQSENWMLTQFENEGMSPVLASWIGMNNAAIAMVVTAAILGCLIATGAMRDQSVIRKTTLVLIAAAIALVVTWGAASVLVWWIPVLESQSAYLPTFIGLLIGCLTPHLPEIIKALLFRVLKILGLNINRRD